MEYITRKYRACDRGAVRKICADTAVFGEPVEACFEDREIAADMLISYYTDYEPKSCFVAVCGETVFGYIAGCIYPGRRLRKTLFRIMPVVFFKAVSRRVLFRRKTISLLGRFSLAFFRWEFFSPRFPEYPSCLHINVDKGFRNSGAGSRLLEEYLEYLRGEKAEAVMIKTKSARAAGFFAASGFRVLYSRDISYLRAPGSRAAKLYVMGRTV